MTPIKTPLEILTDAGFEAYLVGGCVRDHLMNRVPKDVDIATNALPIDVKALFPDAKFVGEAFGVSLIQTPFGSVEIATFRKDGEYSDYRHPDEVTFCGSSKEDASRRDFTINAMYMTGDGEIIDHFNGVLDIESKSIRTVGSTEKRFEEDPLRILRAIRFACELNFHIPHYVLYEMQKMRKKLHSLSNERIGMEVVRMFRANPRQSFYYFETLDFFEELFPEIHTMINVTQDLKYHPEGDVFQHTRSVMYWISKLPIDQRDEVTVLSALLHDIAKPKTREEFPEINRIKFIGHEKEGIEMARAVVRRLRRPVEVEDAVAWIVENHLKPGRASEYRPAKLKRLMSHPYAPQLLRVAWADSMGGYRGDIANLRICRDILRSVKNPIVDLKPKRLLNGHDLKEIFGMSPGPEMGKVLREVEDAELNGDLKTKEEAMDFVLAFLRSKPEETEDTKR